VGILQLVWFVYINLVDYTSENPAIKGILIAGFTNSTFFTIEIVDIKFIYN
jgi:hypothetical protein